MPDLRGYHMICDGLASPSEAQRWTPDTVISWAEAVIEIAAMNVIQGPTAYGGPDRLIIGFAVIAESHMAVHLRPDERACWAELFSCKKFDIGAVLAQTIMRFGLEESGGARWFPRSLLP